jgi:COP9 signalosome complex subunit 6
MPAMSSSNGLTFKLHPLVIVNISDHHTRLKAQSVAQGGSVPRVFGCVIGVQRSHVVEIFNSFELMYDASTHILDRAFPQKETRVVVTFLMRKS